MCTEPAPTPTFRHGRSFRRLSSASDEMLYITQAPFGSQFFSKSSALCRAGLSDSLFLVSSRVKCCRAPADPHRVLGCELDWSVGPCTDDEDGEDQAGKQGQSSEGQATQETEEAAGTKTHAGREINPQSVREASSQRAQGVREGKQRTQAGFAEKINPLTAFASNPVCG